MHVMIDARLAAQLTDFTRQVRQKLQDRKEIESKKERERERKQPRNGFDKRERITVMTFLCFLFVSSFLSLQRPLL